MKTYLSNDKLKQVFTEKDFIKPEDFATPPVENGWEKEFDVFIHGYQGDDGSPLKIYKNEFFRDIEATKSFIRSLLLQTTKEVEAKTRKEVGEMVKGMKYPYRKAVDELGRAPTPTEAFEISKERGFNSACDDIYQRVMGKK